MKRIPKVLCNPTEIRDLFVNIINNALDAMLAAVLHSVHGVKRALYS